MKMEYLKRVWSYYRSYRKDSGLPVLTALRGAIIWA